MPNLVPVWPTKSELLSARIEQNSTGPPRLATNRLALHVLVYLAQPACVDDDVFPISQALGQSGDGAMEFKPATTAHVGSKCLDVPVLTVGIKELRRASRLPRDRPPDQALAHERYTHDGFVSRPR